MDPPTLESLPPGWTGIEPGGDTTCAHGDRFRFFVRPGTVNRVILEFRGGGACWSAETCSPGNPFFQQTAAPEPFIADESLARGVRDHANERNPFKDWHHVYVPYCTGDIHRGDATRTYGSGATAFTLQHKGGVNVRAVLDWVYENFSAPEKAFVTGCSAGAYGSILWSAYVREHYANTKVYQFADSGAGVVTERFIRESYPQWNGSASYPTFIPGVGPGSFEHLPLLYQAIGNHFDDLFISQYNPAYDDQQHLYYSAMGGGSVDEWSAAMRANVSEIAETTPAFRSYISPGYQHCVLPYASFYEVASGGIALVDWISDVIEDRPVESVTCGDQCGR